MSLAGVFSKTLAQRTVRNSVLWLMGGPIRRTVSRPARDMTNAARSLRCHQILPQRQESQFESTRRSGLVERIRQMMLDRLQTDTQSFRDIAVAGTRDHGGDDLQFAGSQPVPASDRSFNLPNRLCQVVCNTAANHVFAIHDTVDAIDQLTRDRLLEDNPASAQLNRPEQ